MARVATAPEASTISVRVAPLMGQVQEFILAEGATVGQALEAAGFNSDSEVRVTTAGGENQTIASNNAILDNGDLITVVASGKVEAGL